MTNDIAEILKDILAAESLPYIEKLAGLVQSETKIDGIKKEGSVMKVYPVYCPLKEACEPNKTEPLVPDKNTKSLFYFETASDTLFKGREKGRSFFTADLWLVGWLNPKALGSNECSISAPIIAQILNVLDKSIFNGPGGVYSMVKIRPVSIKTKEKSIFQKYKLGKQFYHLLEYPYDYFAIRFNVDFAIHNNCINDFIVNPKIPC